MADGPLERPCIYVLAGTNGAGKSSIGGAMLRQAGAVYFNPDEAAHVVQLADSSISVESANSIAWWTGKRLLERAIRRRLTFAFETTLGGHTITALLEQAIKANLDVRIWYVGLGSVDLHIQRVRARVAKGGHDIPDDTIRARYERSRENLIRLLPGLAELRVYDNSDESNPSEGRAPQPVMVLHTVKGRIGDSIDTLSTPEWARAIVDAAVRISVAGSTLT